LTWLIAEDEADIRNLIALMCQVWGHTPLTFENGQKVWDWLDTVEQGQPDAIPELILMDIRMPGKKGNELANRMRTLEPLQRTPIVLMTAFSLSDQERGDMISGDGVDRILSKPLPDFEQLRGILDDIVQQKRASTAKAPPPAAAPPAPASVPDSSPVSAAAELASPPPSAQLTDVSPAAPAPVETLTGQQPPASEVTESPTNTQEKTMPTTPDPPTREADQT
jgi:CheY-like chemotaxis protein